MATVDEALQDALRKPDYYYGPIDDLVEQGWARVFGRNRDSDNMSISNYETVLEAFAEKYEINEDYRVEGSSHWLVGWSDEILVRALDCKCEDWENAYFTYTNNVEGYDGEHIWYCTTCQSEADVRPIFFDAWNFAERIQEYPLLDEEDYSRREHEDLFDYINNELYHAMTEEMHDDDSFEPDAEDVARYLFDEHSVSCVDDVNSEWITDALVAQWQKQWDEYAKNYNVLPGQEQM